MSQRIAVLFDNFGPYHIARLKACANVMNLLAIENRRVSSEYAWLPAPYAPFRHTTLVDNASNGGISAMRDLLVKTLSAFRPTAIAVPGWSSWLALSAIRWANSEKIPVIVMSESQEVDFQRVFWREDIKKRILRFCDAALVGGQPHRDYMIQLGMPAEVISVGYDVVDNSYFSAESAEVRLHPERWRRDLDMPLQFFLCSARFIQKKNLAGLLRAYKLFLERFAAAETSGDQWHLVLLGDGELRAEIETTTRKLGLCDRVHLPGFRQIGELPPFYALAGAFIHPSTTEQWGLVVNEAMAAGLPVLVSERCGCAPDLVESGKNGFTFNPFDLSEMADRMLKIATMQAREREAMGRASEAIIARWSPETFADSLQRAVDVALAVPPRRAGLLDKLLLRLLSHR